MTKSMRLKILFVDIMTDNRKADIGAQKSLYGGKAYAKHVESLLNSRQLKVFSVDGSHDKLPDPRGFDAVIMGGSHHNPVDGEEKPWILRVYKYIRKTSGYNIPILGICGGLQFTVKALGGKVIYNPKGREFGTVKIALTKDGLRDPIFKNLPRSIKVQESHKCMTKTLRPDWKLLATSKLCHIQAIAIGENIRLTQFHPEMSKSHLTILARTRKDIFLEEGLVKNEKEFNTLVRSLTDTEKTGKQILQNFITYFVVPYHSNHSKLSSPYQGGVVRR